MEELKISKSFDGTIIYLKIGDANIQVKHDIVYYSNEFGLDKLAAGKARTFKLKEVE